MSIEALLVRLKNADHLERVGLVALKVATDVLAEDTSGMPPARAARRAELARRIITPEGPRRYRELVAAVLVATQAPQQNLAQLITSVAAQWDALAGVDAADRASV